MREAASPPAGPSYATNHADVVSTASVKDFRNLGRGEVSVHGDTTTLTGGYAYGTEHDYRSSSLHVNARTDALQHDTQFELSYAHNFDKVCNRVQSANAVLPSEWIALEDSVGCEVRVPQLLGLWHPTRVLGSAAIASIEIAVDPHERPAKVEEALVGATMATCDRARVELVSLDADGARWRVSGVPKHGNGAAALADAVAQAIADRGIALGRAKGAHGA